MSRVGSASGRGDAPASPRVDRPFPPVVVALLIALSLWSAAYEAACTVAPGLLSALPFQGIAPDLAFAFAGLVLIAGLSREEIENIRQAAELHDLGKVAIPDAICSSPGR